MSESRPTGNTCSHSDLFGQKWEIFVVKKALNRGKTKVRVKWASGATKLVL